MVTTNSFTLLQSTKTVQETFADLRRLFQNHGIEDFESFPGDGPAYSVRYLQAGAWITVTSTLQPTKAQNLRQCYIVVHNMFVWQDRGVTGVAGTQAFMVTGLVPVNSKRTGGDDFAEACVTLGVEPTDNLDEIEAVYRVKVQRAHPDHGGDAERFKRLNAAIEMIRKVKVKG